MNGGGIGQGKLLIIERVCSMLVTILATIFVFSVIVVIHELGHFITAKITGMQVDEFAVGFGPTLISRRWGSTLYSLRMIPLGGFNRIAGMVDVNGGEDDTTVEIDKTKWFTSKPLAARFLVMVAGAMMNFLLAIVLVWGIYWVEGTVSISTEPVVGATIADSPAAQSKLQAGDRILSINGNPIQQWDDITVALANHDKEVLTVEIQRQGNRISKSIIPHVDETTKRVTMGIYPVQKTHTHPFGEAGKLAVIRVGRLSSVMVQGIYQMIVGKTGADIAGPIGIAQLAGQVASLGFSSLLMFTAFLSTNLGIINLLPIPVLDGGHIILLLLEAVRRKRLPERALMYVQITGMVILGSIFLFSLVKDILRLL